MQCTHPLMQEAQSRTRRRSSHRSTPRTPVAPPPEGLTPEIAATIMEEVQITVRGEEGGGGWRGREEEMEGRDEGGVEGRRREVRESGGWKGISLVTMLCMNNHVPSALHITDRKRTEKKERPHTINKISFTTTSVVRKII